ncbi:transcriptional repressor [Dermatophilaceae bacterium Soc4.6]
MPDLGDALRAQGKRLTPQRRRILDAVSHLEHATPDLIAKVVGQDGGAELPQSTIYRGLEVLEELGFVAHTHLDHRAPSYHRAGHATHIHLVCLGCGVVGEAPIETAAAFIGNLRAAHGFEADVTHMAVHGWCAECAREPGRHHGGTPVVTSTSVGGAHASADTPAGSAPESRGPHEHPHPEH